MRREERFKEFAKVINYYFPPKKYKTVADIAGGKGHLQKELNSRGYTAITFDKNRDRRKRVKGTTYHNKYFTKDTKGHFDLLVGLHPDEATDVIVITAIEKRLPFVIAPCCVLPTATKFTNTDRSYNKWIEHLIRIAESGNFKVSTREMPINGAKLCIIGIPK